MFSWVRPRYQVKEKGAIFAQMNKIIIEILASISTMIAREDLDKDIENE